MSDDLERHLADLHLQLSLIIDREITEAAAVVRGYIDGCRQKGHQPSLEQFLIDIGQESYRQGETVAEVGKMLQPLIVGWMACNEIWHKGKP